MIIDSGMAFSEGFFARNDGQERGANPYREGLERWQAWQAGWDEAVATAHAMQTMQSQRPLLSKPAHLLTLEGEEAASAGTPVASDPYPDGTLESDLWLAGWTAYSTRRRLGDPYPPVGAKLPDLSGSPEHTPWIG